MSDKSLIPVVKWINGRRWPRGKNLQPILVISPVLDGKRISFIAPLGLFELEATYHHNTRSLIDLQIVLDLPTFFDKIHLPPVKSYALSTTEGEPIVFDLANGTATGKLSLCYADHNGKQSIVAAFSVIFPILPHLNREITVCVASIAALGVLGFQTAELKSIPSSTLSELKTDEGEEALLTELLNGALGKNESTVVSETPLRRLWEGDITFLYVFKLHGDVDPTTLEIVGALYTNVLTLGRVRLAPVKGSLLGAGVSVDVNDPLATGKATFAVSKNEDGKYDLYVNADFDSKLHGKASTDRKIHIYTFPF